MPPCGRCGADVRHVYDPDDDLMTIDAERVADGNVSLDGCVSAHRVAPGAGNYRVHDCASAPAMIAPGDQTVLENPCG